MQEYRCRNSTDRIPSVREKSTENTHCAYSPEILCHRINFRRTLRIRIRCSIFPFYHNLIRKADDGTAVLVHSLLFHTVMIRTGCFDHCNFSIFDLADIGVSNVDDLVLGKRIGSEFFSVNGNTDRIMGTFPRNLKTKPENPRQNQDPGNKNQFFFLQNKSPFLLQIQKNHIIIEIKRQT